MDIQLSQLPAGDPKLIDAIVQQLKSGGKFDQFRKECLADVDTKPAYQNLQLRVESQVKKFLEKTQWKSDLNKNQLRDTVRKHVQESGMLDTGIDTIINQVVNPKVQTVILPCVQESVYAFLNIKPSNESKDGGSSGSIKISDVSGVLYEQPHSTPSAGGQANAADAGMNYPPHMPQHVPGPQHGMMPPPAVAPPPYQGGVPQHIPPQMPPQHFPSQFPPPPHQQQHQPYHLQQQPTPHQYHMPGHDEQSRMYPPAPPIDSGLGAPLLPPPPVGHHPLPPSIGPPHAVDLHAGAPPPPMMPPLGSHSGFVPPEVPAPMEMDSPGLSRSMEDVEHSRDRRDYRADVSDPRLAAPPPPEDPEHHLEDRRDYRSKYSSSKLGDDSDHKKDRHDYRASKYDEHRGGPSSSGGAASPDRKEKHDYRSSKYESDYHKERHEYRKHEDRCRSPPPPPPQSSSSRDDKHHKHDRHSHRTKYDDKRKYEQRKYDRKYEERRYDSDEAMEYEKKESHRMHRREKRDYDREYGHSSSSSSHMPGPSHRTPLPDQEKPSRRHAPLLPMETDVISSEEDDILGAKSDSNSPHEKSQQASGDDSVSRPASAASDTVARQVQNLSLQEEPGRLFDAHSLDSISSNSSGLSFAASSKGSNKTPDQNKTQETAVHRSGQSTPLVDEPIGDASLTRSQSSSSRHSSVGKIGGVSDGELVSDSEERGGPSSLPPPPPGSGVTDRLVSGASPISADDCSMGSSTGMMRDTTPDCENIDNSQQCPPGIEDDAEPCPPGTDNKISPLMMPCSPSPSPPIECTSPNASVKADIASSTANTAAVGESSAAVVAECSTTDTAVTTSSDTTAAPADVVEAETAASTEQMQENSPDLPLARTEKVIAGRSTPPDQSSDEATKKSDKSQQKTDDDHYSYKQKAFSKNDDDDDDDDDKDGDRKNSPSEGSNVVDGCVGLLTTTAGEGNVASTEESRQKEGTSGQTDSLSKETVKLHKSKEESKVRHLHVVARPHVFPNPKGFKIPANGSKDKDHRCKHRSSGQSSSKKHKKEVKPGHVPTAFENALLGVKYTKKITSSKDCSDKEPKSQTPGKTFSKESRTNDSSVKSDLVSNSSSDKYSKSSHKEEKRKHESTKHRNDKEPADIKTPSSKEKTSSSRKEDKYYSKSQRDDKSQSKDHRSKSEAYSDKSKKSDSDKKLLIEASSNHEDKSRNKSCDAKKDAHKDKYKTSSKNRSSETSKREEISSGDSRYSKQSLESENNSSKDSSRVKSHKEGCASSSKEYIVKENKLDVEDKKCKDIPDSENSQSNDGNDVFSKDIKLSTNSNVTSSSRKDKNTSLKRKLVIDSSDEDCGSNKKRSKSCSSTNIKTSVEENSRRSEATDRKSGRSAGSKRKHTKHSNGVMRSKRKRSTSSASRASIDQSSLSGSFSDSSVSHNPTSERKRVKLLTKKPTPTIANLYYSSSDSSDEDFSIESSVKSNKKHPSNNLSGDGSDRLDELCLDSIKLNKPKTSHKSNNSGSDLRLLLESSGLSSDEISIIKPKKSEVLLDEVNNAKDSKTPKKTEKLDFTSKLSKGSTQEKLVSKLPTRRTAKTRPRHADNEDCILVTAEDVVIKTIDGKQLVLCYEERPPPEPEDPVLDMFYSDNSEDEEFEGFGYGKMFSPKFDWDSMSDKEDFEGFNTVGSPRVIIKDMYDFVGFPSFKSAPSRLALYLQNNKDASPTKKKHTEDDLSMIVTIDMFNEQLPIKVFLDAMVKIGAKITGFHAFLAKSKKKSNQLESTTFSSPCVASGTKSDETKPNKSSQDSSCKRLTPDPSDSELPEYDFLGIKPSLINSVTNILDSNANTDELTIISDVNVVKDSNNTNLDVKKMIGVLNNEEFIHKARLDREKIPRATVNIEKLVGKAVNCTGKVSRSKSLESDEESVRTGGAVTATTTAAAAPHMSLALSELVLLTPEDDQQSEGSVTPPKQASPYSALSPSSNALGLTNAIRSEM